MCRMPKSESRAPLLVATELTTSRLPRVTNSAFGFRKKKYILEGGHTMSRKKTRNPTRETLCLLAPHPPPPPRPTNNTAALFGTAVKQLKSVGNFDLPPTLQTSSSGGIV